MLKKTLKIISRFSIGLLCLYAVMFLVILGISEFINGEYYMVLFVWTAIGFYSVPFIIGFLILLNIFMYFYN